MNATLKPVTGAFEKTKGWLDWYDGPSKPHFKLPPGSIDAHCHVFGPGAEFPYAPERKYTPCDAGKSQLFALRDWLGFSRNVVVQATCHGADNRAMVDACIASSGRARGVATVKREVSEAELKRLHEAGVRGVRFNFVKRLVDFTPKHELIEIADRIARLGWTSSFTSRPRTSPSSGISSPRYRPPSSSTTWGGPTSGSQWTARSSRSSSNSCGKTPTSGPKCRVPSASPSLDRRRSMGSASPTAISCHSPDALSKSFPTG